MDKPEQAKFRIAGNTGGRFFSNAECLVAPEKKPVWPFSGGGLKLRYAITRFCW